ICAVGYGWIGAVGAFVRARRKRTAEDRGAADACFELVFPMPPDQLTHYRSRAARALVLLHEREMRQFLPVWHRAVATRILLPATDDPDYASLETLLHHVLRASRGYMTWMCDQLGLPDPGIEPAPGPEVVAREAARYLEHLLERWRIS